MTDLELLFLVLALLYGWECACWTRRGAVGFRTWLGRRWAVRHPGMLLGNGQGGLIFAHPLPPLGTLLLGRQLPISLSPEVVLAFVSSSVNPGGRPAQSAKWFRWQEIKQVTASGKRVNINGQPFLRAGSPGQAEDLAQHLRQLRDLAPAKREKAIDDLVRERFDSKAVEQRWQDFTRQAAGLRRAVNVLFLYLFLAVPSLIWVLGLSRTWPGLLAGLFACTSFTAFLFRRAHRHFYPQAEDERFTHFLLVLLSPVTSIRAHDLLARPLLEGFHPLALAKVFCTAEQFRKLARDILVELRYPALPLCPCTESEPRAAEQHTRALAESHVKKLVQKSGLSPEELFQPPARADDTCLAYCPRCHSQFTTTSGLCEDCGGLALVAFAGAEPKAAAGPPPAQKQTA